MTYLNLEYAIFTSLNKLVGGESCARAIYMQEHTIKFISFLLIQYDSRYYRFIFNTENYVLKKEFWRVLLENSNEILKLGALGWIRISTPQIRILMLIQLSYEGTLLADQTGLEPITLSFGDWCSTIELLV